MRGNGVVMVKAKGKMADVLKRMMAAKLKARLGLSDKSAEDEEEKPMSGESEMGEDETTGEAQISDEEREMLRALYEKLAK